jgi:hypothetical protein
MAGADVGRASRGKNYLRFLPLVSHWICDSVSGHGDWG